MQKRFYTRGTLRGIRISQLAWIPTFYHVWLRSLNLEMGEFLEFPRIEGEFELHSMCCTKCRANC